MHGLPNNRVADGTNDDKRESWGRGGKGGKIGMIWHWMECRADAGVNKAVKAAPVHGAASRPFHMSMMDVMSMAVSPSAHDTPSVLSFPAKEFQSCHTNRDEFE